MLPLNILLALAAALTGHEVLAKPVDVGGLLAALIPGIGGAGEDGGVAGIVRAAKGGGKRGGYRGGKAGKNGNGNKGGAAGGRQPSAQQIDTAAQSWQADTETVSQFLSTAESLSGQQLEKAASKALAAENDELSHKAVLDRMFLKRSQNNRVASVAQANRVLDTQGTFQFVVDGLQKLTDSSSQMSQAEVTTVIQAINDGRCPKVLPNIDRYLAAAAAAGQSGAALKAIRPMQCQDGGQNGNGGNGQNGNGQNGNGQNGNGQNGNGQNGNGHDENGGSGQNGNGQDENNQTGNGQNEQVGNDQNEQVGNNQNEQNEQVGNKQNEQVGNGQNGQVGNGQNEQVSNG
ncbi:hypothetical protein C2857_002631 [Epichloe festucae Fl1]|uniref:SXP/RAL-2 family protein Ani s 5-like cation-binding domain-containing protein n=1 Tax=Epichloe festucae (strain Fl1) TaxID=877507 RepID=A0A7S9PTN9_EPIFF|nr:hypothetical protein C2857_002631 [Epichloe festucae Fl1]